MEIAETTTTSQNETQSESFQKSPLLVRLLILLTELINSLLVTMLGWKTSNSETQNVSKIQKISSVNKETKGQDTDFNKRPNFKLKRPLCVKLHVCLINLTFDLLVLLFDREWSYHEKTDKSTDAIDSFCKKRQISRVSNVSSSSEKEHLKHDDFFTELSNEKLSVSKTQILDEKKKSNILFKFVKGLLTKDNEVCLLLTGKTGNGKSATGNSILGTKAFKRSGDSQSVTQDVQFSSAEFEGRIIRICDTPGVGDTYHIDDVAKATEIVIQKMKDAVILNPQGYHAFLLVIKFGNRLTAEEKECIRLLKAIFGPDFMNKYCILIISGGDLFDSDEKGQSFEQWCKQQTGVFKELFEECKGRAILFDNLAKDEKVLKRQRKKLITLVKKMPNNGKTYTDSNFELVEENRRKIMVEAKEPLVHQRVISVNDMISKKIKTCYKMKLEEEFNELEKLLPVVAEIKSFVEEHDDETGLLEKSKSTVCCLLDRIHKRMDDIKSIRYERDNAHLQLEEAKRSIENEKQKLKEKLEKEKVEIENSKDKAIQQNNAKLLEIITVQGQNMQEKYREGLKQLNNQLQLKQVEIEVQLRKIENELKSEHQKEVNALRLANAELQYKLDNLLKNSSEYFCTIS